MVEFVDLTDEQRIERFEQLAERALREYGIAGATLTHRTYTENVIFEVTRHDGDLHASLRICRPGWEEGALRREICWLTALRRDTGLRVPEPIPTRDGAAFCVVETDGIHESRACVLFSWIDGTYAAPEELTPARLRKVGRFLATLHDHAERFRLPSELAVDRFDANALEASSHRDNISTYFTDERDLEAFDDAIAATVTTMRELDDGKTVAGIIHGDFHQRNYIFDGDAVGALDFETMWWSYYLYDLATTLSYLTPDFLRDIDPEPLRAAVLEGYAQQRGLPERYNHYLNVFSAYRVWIMADWASGSPRQLSQDWARRRLDAMPEQIRTLLGTS